MKRKLLICIATICIIVALMIMMIARYNKETLEVVTNNIETLRMCNMLINDCDEIEMLSDVIKSNDCEIFAKGVRYDTKGLLSIDIEVYNTADKPLEIKFDKLNIDGVKFDCNNSIYLGERNNLINNISIENDKIDAVNSIEIYIMQNKGNGETYLLEPLQIFKCNDNRSKMPNFHNVQSELIMKDKDNCEVYIQGIELGNEITKIWIKTHNKTGKAYLVSAREIWINNKECDFYFADCIEANNTSYCAIEVRTEELREPVINDLKMELKLSCGETTKTQDTSVKIV